MYKIKTKENLTKDTVKLKIEAPEIAKNAKAGQFVIVVIDEKGERIPLTLADWDKETGTITLIFQQVGFSTEKLAKLNPGDSISHILGPLGHPAEVKKYGTIICVAGGVGIAEAYPVAKAFKDSQNRVIGILGARTKELLILKNKMQEVCDEIFITTDDGSEGKKGLVTDSLKELFDIIEKSTHTKYPDLVYTIGPVKMMSAVANMTKNYQIKTIACLNPILVDATGMCGSCRCKVEGKTVFACVDGPDFDAHKVDFKELENRLSLFKTQEKYSR